MDQTEIIGLAAGVLTSSSLLPQIIKTIREKKADEVSLVMLLVLLGGVGIWVYYGFLRKDFPIIATNCFSLLLNILMIFLRIKYKQPSSKSQ